MSDDAGKGDTYRRVDQKVYGENYDRIFRPSGRGLEQPMDAAQERNDQTPHEQTADDDEAGCPICGALLCIHGVCTSIGDCPACQAGDDYEAAGRG